MTMPAPHCVRTTVGCGNLEVQIVAQTRVLQAAARALVLRLPLPLKLNPLYATTLSACCCNDTARRTGRFPAAAARQPIRACVCVRSDARQQRCEPARRGCVREAARKRRGWRGWRAGEGVKATPCSIERRGRQTSRGSAMLFSARSFRSAADRQADRHPSVRCTRCTRSLLRHTAHTSQCTRVAYNVP